MSNSIDAKAQEWFTLGCSALEAHPSDLQSAIASFTRAIFLCPTAGVLWYHRGESYFRLCDFRAAMVNFRRAHALEPTAHNIRQRLSQLHFILGRLALDSGDISASVRSFTSALELHPENTDFWIFRIKAWIRGKSYGKALQELNEFITHPSSEEYFAPQQLQQQQNRDSGTNRSTKDSQRKKRMQQQESKDGDIEDDSDDDHHLDSAAPVEDEDANAPLDLDSSAPAPALLTARGRATALSLWRTVQALILRAKLHVLLSRSDLALRDAGWAMHLAPGNPEVSALLETLSQKAEFLYGTALAHILAGEPEMAIQELTKALELNPHQVKFYSLRSGLLRDAKKYDDALKDIKMALSISESIRVARRAKKQAQQQAQSQSQAASSSADPQQTFVTATGMEEEEEEKEPEQIELEKSLALTFNGLGVQYFQGGHFSHSLSCFSKSIELSPGSSTFYLNRGDAYLALATEVRQHHQHQQAHTIHAQQPPSLHIGQSEEDQALSDYQKAKELDPNAPVARKVAEIHAKRGRELFNCVDYESSLSEFHRSIVADPSISGHYVLRARVHSVLGQYERAYEDAERAVWLDPSNIEARNLVLSLRGSLLRPTDLSRAPLLPPVPKKDSPWIPSMLRPKQVEERLERRREQGLSTGGGNGQSILSLVYGDQARAGVAVVRQKQAKRAAGARR